MGKHRTTSARNKRQKLKATYGRVREEAQLQGIIPTTPEGAAKSERVNPAVQTEQQFPALVAEAARNGWATPEHIKPKIVDALVEPFVKRDVVYAPDGSEYEVPPDRYLLTKNAQVLATLDKMQHERDNPKDEGGDTNVNVNTQVNVVNWDSLAQRPQYVDPVDTAIQALPTSNNEPTTETGPDGGEQPAVAE